MKKKPTFWVYDIETITNCIVFVFTDYLSDVSYTFRINRKINEFDELFKFLLLNIENRDWHFGYNNLAFDAQIIENIIQNADTLETLDANQLSAYIYEYAQYVIQKPKDQFADYPEWELSIRNLDVFKINHWNNKNRMTALKWLQYSMDWKNIEEMPHHHSKPIRNNNDLAEVVSYCINDVLSTKRVVQLSRKAINMRTNLKNKYDISCTNWSNTKIGSELLLKLYCKRTGKKRWDVKDLRTYRPVMDFKNIIFPYIKFKSDVFKDFLNEAKDKVITTTKNAFSEVVKFKGYEFVYGLGGIHQCIHKGVYSSDEDLIIEDIDVNVASQPC